MPSSKKKQRKERQRQQREEAERRREQANGEAPHANSGEAGDDAEAGEDGGEGSTAAAGCRHLKFVQPNDFRRALQRLKNRAIQCQECSKDAKKGRKSNKGVAKSTEEGEPESSALYMCLSCGHIGCPRSSPAQHSLKHFKERKRCPIALNTENFRSWCFECDDFLEDKGVDFDSHLGQRIMECKDMLNKHGSRNVGETGGNERSTPSRGASSKPGNPSSSSSQPTDLSALPSDSPMLGFNNLGNTCFFNSIMQNLGNSSALWEKFVTVPTSEDGNLQGALRAFLVQMRLNGRKSSMSPGAMLNAVRKQNSMFFGGRQHDSHEVLRTIVNGMRDEKIEVQQKKRKKELAAFVRSWDGDYIDKWLAYMGIEDLTHYREAVAMRPESRLSGVELLRWLTMKWTDKRLKKELRIFSFSQTDRDKFRVGFREMRSTSSQFLKDGLAEWRKAKMAENGSGGGADEGGSKSTGADADDEGGSTKSADADADAQPSSIVDDVFGGVLESSVTCTECKTQSVTREPFFDISLPIEPPNSSPLGGGGRFGSKRGRFGSRRLSLQGLGVVPKKKTKNAGLGRELDMYGGNEGGGSKKKGKKKQKNKKQRKKNFMESLNDAPSEEAEQVAMLNQYERQKADKQRKEEADKKAEQRRKEKAAAQEAHEHRRREMRAKVLKHNEEEAARRRAAAAAESNGESGGARELAASNGKNIASGNDANELAEVGGESPEAGVEAITDHMASLDLSPSGDAENAPVESGAPSVDRPQGTESLSGVASGAAIASSAENNSATEGEPSGSSQEKSSANISSSEATYPSQGASSSTETALSLLEAVPSSAEIFSSRPRDFLSSFPTPPTPRPRSGSFSALDVASSSLFSRPSTISSTSALDLASGFAAPPSRGGARHARSLSDAASAPLSLLQVQARVENSRLLSGEAADPDRGVAVDEAADPDRGVGVDEAADPDPPKSFADALNSKPEVADSSATASGEADKSAAAKAKAPSSDSRQRAAAAAKASKLASKLRKCGANRLKGDVDLRTCLDAFFDPELLTGANAYGCEHCTKVERAKLSGNEKDGVMPTDEKSSDEKSSDDEDSADALAAPTGLVKRDALKRYQLLEMPRVLTVHLKRFTQRGFGGLSKSGKTVPFTETLDLSDFVSKSAKRNGGEVEVEGEGGEDAAATSCCYRLFGISVHSGGMHGGHYVAYVRKATHSPGDGRETSAQWFHVSDSHFSKVALKDALGAQAYILFYERIDG